MTKIKHVKKVKLISTDDGLKIECSISGEYELAKHCESCSNFVRIDVVDKSIACRRY